jgi:hypothetical protein
VFWQSAKTCLLFIMLFPSNFFFHFSSTLICLFISAFSVFNVSKVIPGLNNWYFSRAVSPRFVVFCKSILIFYNSTNLFVSITVSVFDIDGFGCKNAVCLHNLLSKLILNSAHHLTNVVAILGRFLIAFTQLAS